MSSSKGKKKIMWCCRVKDISYDHVAEASLSNFSGSPPALGHGNRHSHTDRSMPVLSRGVKKLKRA